MKRYIRSAVDKLENLPYDLQEELSEDPNTPPEVLAELYEAKERGEAIFKDIIINIAYNPNTPKEILDKLADPKWIPPIRIGVASNPNTSGDTLHKLAHSIFEIQLEVECNPNTRPEDVKYIKQEFKRKYDID